MSTLSTHVLDTSIGQPAAGIPVLLQKDARALGREITDADGRIRQFAPPSPDHPLHPGAYRLIFAVGEYFAARGVRSFYTEISIEFMIDEESEHYHVPLLLSPYGYCTYRGS